jgi:CHASE2 domain-containing sensor protein
MPKKKIMISGGTLNMYVFLLAFAAAFLLGGKRPFLALSTRVMLVVLLGLALTYAVGNHAFRAYAGIATLIANVLFIAFAVIDYVNWQKNRAADRP